MRMGLHDWMKFKEEAKTGLGERLVSCVRLTLEHGFDGHQRDASRQLAYHILEDHRSALATALSRELEALLQPFDGPREAYPGRPACICGLNL